MPREASIAALPHWQIATLERSEVYFFNNNMYPQRFFFWPAFVCDVLMR
jgi:hypothetical protein